MNLLCRSDESSVGHASQYDAASATDPGSPFEERGRGDALTSHASPAAACTPAAAASAFSLSPWIIPPFAIVRRRAVPFHVVGDAEPARSRRGASEERGKKRKREKKKKTAAVGEPRPVVYQQLSPYVSTVTLPDRLSRDAANVSSRPRTLGEQGQGRERPRMPFEPLLRAEVRYTLGGPSSIFIGNK